MKKETNKKKEMSIEDLALMVAKGFSSIEERMVTKEELKEFKKETTENFVKVRRDILELSDRFVSRSEFDKFLSRFNALEAKVKSKK